MRDVLYERLPENFGIFPKRAYAVKFKDQIAVFRVYKFLEIPKTIKQRYSKHMRMAACLHAVGCENFLIN